jgi:hypothetical protein
MDTLQDKDKEDVLKKFKLLMEDRERETKK